MEKINRQRAPKGTVTIRKKGNSYEARVTLALNSIMEGVDKNPRLSRTARSEQEARKRKVLYGMRYGSRIKSNVIFDRHITDHMGNSRVFYEERYG